MSPGDRQSCCPPSNHTSSLCATAGVSLKDARERLLIITLVVVLITTLIVCRSVTNKTSFSNMENVKGQLRPLPSAPSHFLSVQLQEEEQEEEPEYADKCGRHGVPVLFTACAQSHRGLKRMWMSTDLLSVCRCQNELQKPTSSLGSVAEFTLSQFMLASGGTTEDLNLRTQTFQTCP